MNIQKTTRHFKLSLILFFAFFGKSYGQNLTIYTSNATCCGLSNGAITVYLYPPQPNCGPGPYQYQIVGTSPATAPITSAVTSSTTFSWSGLMAGTYTINVLTGGTTCESGSVTITEPLCLSGALSSTNVTCSGWNDGSLFVIPIGGVPVYSISISGPTLASGTVPFTGGSLAFTNLPAGVYTVIITDTNWCSHVLNTTITSPPPLSVNVVGTAASSSTALDGSATVNFSGGIPPYTLSWDIGAPTQTINSLGVGVYTCCVTDANNCVSCDSFAVIDATMDTICVAGQVFCDQDNNGIMNSGELPLANVPVTLSVQNPVFSTISVTVFTDASGYFSYCGQLSSITNNVSASINPQWLSAHGYAALAPSVNLAGSSSAGTTTAGMIAVNCSPTPCADLWSNCNWTFWGGGIFQGMPALMTLGWGNNGPNAVGSYTLSLTIPAGVTLNTSSIVNSNYTISGNTITWNFTSSQNNFTMFENISFNVPFGLGFGTALIFTSSITATGSIIDCAVQNNNGFLITMVGGSYDPNDKVASRDAMYQNLQNNTEEIDVNIQDVLTYTVRFQNTGTAPAQNIYILDTLDANLDWSTFMPMQSSHPMIIIDLGNGVKRFEFNQIWLPDSSSNEPASHGALTYRIQENANNLVGSTIENTAHIFFDWNAPIITNTTYNINTTFGGIDETAENQLLLFPNPTAEILNIHISTSMENSSYTVLDCFGRNVGKGILDAKQNSISVKHLANGLYHLQIGTQRVQFIVAH
jgi:uncharacterized repeat protein (TIGR01451 family)